MSNKEEIKEIEKILKNSMSKDEREFYEERAKIFKEKMEVFDNEKIKKVIQLTKLNIAKNSLSKIFYLENKNITIKTKESTKYDIETLFNRA